MAKNRHPKTRPVKHGVQCHSSGLTPQRNKKLRIRVACLSQHDRSTWSTERKDRCNDHGGTCCNLSAYHPTIGCVVTLAPASLQTRAAARSKQVPRLPSAPDIGHAENDWTREEKSGMASLVEFFSNLKMMHWAEQNRCTGHFQNPQMDFSTLVRMQHRSVLNKRNRTTNVRSASCPDPKCCFRSFRIPH